MWKKLKASADLLAEQSRADIRAREMPDFIKSWLCGCVQFSSGLEMEPTITPMNVALLFSNENRAPAGGVTIQGHFYKGGEFIPSEVMDAATPEERAKIEGGESDNPDVPRKEKPQGQSNQPNQQAGADADILNRMKAVEYNRAGNPYRAIDENERAQLDRETGWIANATPEQMKAVKTYTGGAYRKINQFLREGQLEKESPTGIAGFLSRTFGDQSARDLAVETAQTLHDMIDANPLPEPIITYRGIGPGAFADEILAQAKAAVGSGDKLTLKGLNSSSKRAELAQTFAGQGGVMFQVVTKTGLSVAPASATDEKEMEIIQKHAQNYKILEVDESDPFGPVIRMVEIEGEQSGPLPDIKSSQFAEGEEKEQPGESRFEITKSAVEWIPATKENDSTNRSGDSAPPQVD